MSNDKNSDPGLWSHKVPNQSPALVVVSTLFLLVTTAFFVTRMKERFWPRPEKIYDPGPTANTKRRWADRLRRLRNPNGQGGMDDAMLSTAYTILVIQTIFGGVAAHYGFGKHRASIPIHFTTAMLWFYLYQICYKLLGCFTKLAFCCLYLRIWSDQILADGGLSSPESLSASSSPPSRLDILRTKYARWHKVYVKMHAKHFRRLVIVTAAISASGTLAFTVATIFQCTPVQRAWDRQVPGHCIPNLEFWFSHASFNTFMDVVVFLLPIPVIDFIKVSQKQRNGLKSIFALGAFVILASVVRMGLLRGSAASTTDPTWGSMPALIWTEIEANTSVIVCCLPGLRRVARDLWRNIAKKVGLPLSQDASSSQKPQISQDPSVLQKLSTSDESAHVPPFGIGNITTVESNRPTWLEAFLRYWRVRIVSKENEQVDVELAQIPQDSLGPKLKTGGLYDQHKRGVTHEPEADVNYGHKSPATSKPRPQAINKEGSRKGLTITKTREFGSTNRDRKSLAGNDPLEEAFQKQRTEQGHEEEERYQRQVRRQEEQQQRQQRQQEQQQILLKKQKLEAEARRSKIARDREARESEAVDPQQRSCVMS